MTCEELDGKGRGHLQGYTASLPRGQVRAETWIHGRPLAPNDHESRKVDSLKADSSYLARTRELYGKNGYEVREHS